MGDAVEKKKSATETPRQPIAHRLYVFIVQLIATKRATLGAARMVQGTGH